MLVISSFATLMKKRFKHIIPLFLLLFFSSGSFFTHSFAKAVSQENFAKIELDHSFDIQSSTAISSPDKEIYKKKEIVVENEEEEYENITSKKNFEKKSYFVSFFNQKRTHFLFYHFNNSFASCKEFFYLPSYNSLYIIFEVFRI
jgi:hypothetical protein